MKSLTDPSRRAIVLIAFAVVVGVTLGHSPVSAQAGTQQDVSVGQRFGSREPRVCEDSKAPAEGAITAAAAKKYLECQMEYVSGAQLYLVESLEVEVGGGIPYAAIMGQRSLSEINVEHPVYPIRGSLTRYQCSDPVTAHSGPPDTNCNVYNQPKATGYCYKTTFNDWRCYMADSAVTESAHQHVAPPKS